MLSRIFAFRQKMEYKSGPVNMAFYIVVCIKNIINTAYKFYPEHLKFL